MLIGLRERGQTPRIDGLNLNAKRRRQRVQLANPFVAARLPHE